MHLDTGDSTQIRQGSIVIGRKQTRAPHYDTFASRTPLADITNIPTNQISSTPTKMTTAAFNSLPNIQKLMLNGESYDASNRREFEKDLERIESSENSDPELDVAEVSFVSNAATLIQESPGQKTVPKKCSRCRYVEGTRRNGVLVLFDINLKTGKKYASCRSCKAYNDTHNPKNSLKVRILFKLIFPMTYPLIAAELTHLLQLVGI